MSATSFYDPRESHCHPPSTSLGGPPRPAGRLAPGSCEVSAFGLGPSTGETFCVPSKSGVSVSPSPMELLQSSPAGLQNQILWGLLLPMATLRLGSLTWDSELSLLWENFSNIIVLRFVDHHLGCMGFDYITSMPLLLSCGFFFTSLDVEYLC